MSLEARFQNLVHEVELISIVEPIGEFVEVEGKILRGDFVKNANDTALEKRPNILASVGVDFLSTFAPNVGFAMIDSPMSKFRAIEPQVRSELIGVNFRSGSRVLTDEILENTRTYVVDGLHTDGA